jgi:hypothetical protein
MSGKRSLWQYDGYSQAGAAIFILLSLQMNFNLLGASAVA